MEKSTGKKTTRPAIAAVLELNDIANTWSIGKIQLKAIRVRIK
jgi:hypothetical protein